MRRNSFPIIGTEIFNCLPAHIKDLSISQQTFKKRLDEFLSLIPDKPQIGEGSKIFHSKKLDNIDQTMEMDYLCPPEILQ